MFGVTCAISGEELTHFKIHHVKDYGSEIVVNITDIKKNGPKVFPINGEFAEIVRKYMELRPANAMTDRFFLQYNQGECNSQAIGKNKIAIVPKEIAKFLKLDAYKTYTSHSFRALTSHSFRALFSNSSYETLNRKRRKTTTIAKAKLRGACSNINSNVAKSIVMPNNSFCDTFYEKTDLNEQQTEPIMSMLPLTTALMKRKSKYYMGLQQNAFLHLLQMARERKQLTDVKVMLSLRKLRLNEELEVLGDLFDLDKTTAEQYYHECKHSIIDLVDQLPTTTSTSNQFHVFSEPVIKIEESDDPFVSDPIAVPNARDDSDSNWEMNDQDDFEFPVSAEEEDRGFLSDDIRKRTAECSVCHKFFAPRLLNWHMENVHFNILNLNKTICGLCWKEFDTKVLLKAHQKAAHGGCSYGCDVCGKMFSSKRYIKVHILTKHAEVKAFLCHSCGEGFPVQSSLKAHVLRKHVKRGYDCPSCDKKFVTATSLKDHIGARHTHERLYKCEVQGCNKTFGWPSAFKSHKRVHAEDKYECSICLKQFSFKGNLQNHLKTIHNQIVNNDCLTSKSVRSMYLESVEQCTFFKDEPINT